MSGTSWMRLSWELIGLREGNGPDTEPERSEWPTGLDMTALLEGGWRPTPFRQFILKLHSRCNLACDYCYMYEMADQSWRRMPRRMSKAVIDRTAVRVAEHVDAHGLTRAEVILHGGEPLLAEGWRALGLECQQWLRGALAQPFAGTTVVVTHFAPSLRSADPRYGLVLKPAGEDIDRRTSEDRDDDLLRLPWLQPFRARGVAGDRRPFARYRSCL